MRPPEPAFNITAPKTAQEHFNVAVYADSHEQHEKAIEEYRKALELQPDWALAHFRLAKDLQKQGRQEDAIVHLEKATELDPQFFLAYDTLADAYEREGTIGKAIQAYSALLKYPPMRMPAHYQLGLWYAQMGERQKAKDHLEGYRQAAIGTTEQQSDRFQKALRALRKLE